MKTLIFGAGFIGQRLARDLANAELVRVDIADPNAVRHCLRELRPDTVINAAGKTGTPNVDWCEDHPFETYRANVNGPLVLADACRESGAWLLHLGSGCIFYGDSPQPGGWLEDDYANPSALYSRTKYAADLVLSRLPNVAIARLRMPIDSAPAPRNLITKLAAYRQIVDVENSVTVVEDLVHAARELIARKPSGVFHVVNPGAMRHRDLLHLYREIVDPKHVCEYIDADDLVKRGLSLRARSNCILASPRLASLGITLRPIDVALRDTMRAYAAALHRG